LRSDSQSSNSISNHGLARIEHVSNHLMGLNALVLPPLQSLPSSVLAFSFATWPGACLPAGPPAFVVLSASITVCAQTTSLLSSGCCMLPSPLGDTAWRCKLGQRSCSGGLNQSQKPCSQLIPSQVICAVAWARNRVVVRQSGGNSRAMCSQSGVSGSLSFLLLYVLFLS
jgi:hypothetical protein